MRISTAQMFQSGVDAMQRSQIELNRIGLQMSTGKRILTPADDPSGATQAAQFQQIIRATEQYQRNSDLAAPRLQQEESALTAVTDQLQRARELIVAGANATQTSETRGFMANEIRQIRDALFDIANTKDPNGEYLFGGTRSLSAPFVIDANQNINYVGAEGDGAVRSVAISPIRTVAIGDTGSSVFMRIPENDGKVGGGVEARGGSLIVGRIEVSDLPAFQAKPNARYQLAFENPQTEQPGNRIAYDVAIFDVPDDPLVPPTQLGTARYVFDPRDPGRQQVIELTDDQTGVPPATPLGIRLTLQGDPWNGQVPSATLTGGTFTDDPLGTTTPTSGAETPAAERTGARMTFAGVVPDMTTGDTIAFTYNGTAYTATLTDGTNNLQADIDAAVDGAAPPNALGAGRITAQLAGDDLVLAAAVQTPAEFDGVGIRPAVDVGLFKTLSDIADAFDRPSGNQTSGAELGNAVNRALADLDAGIGRMNDVRATVGTRLQVLESQTNLNSERLVDLKTTLSEIQDLDYAEAISRFKLQEVALQAAQQSYVQMNRLSLFNFL